MTSWRASTPGASSTSGSGYTEGRCHAATLPHRPPLRRGGAGKGRAMRKERLIVPVVVVLAVVWAVAQFLASLLFERELARALADLEARGELVVERSEVERGWLTSSGSVQVSPLLGDGWHLEQIGRASCRERVYVSGVSG